MLQWLGYVVTGEGIEPNSDKVHSILNFPTRKNRKELTGFLGTIKYYNRFVENF